MTSCRLVAEAIATARKLRDAPNNGDAARHGVDVAAHVLDVTRSGAASAGAAKARHVRAGAPLVVRVVWLVLVAIIFSMISFSVNANTYTFTLHSPPLCVSITSPSKNCSDVKSSINACLSTNYPTYSTSSCTTELVGIGTRINFSPSGYSDVTAITGTCTSGYVWNATTLSCESINLTVVCSPAFKTVSPCPTGYAPKEITVQTSQQPDAYQTTLDAMPLQEMLYALCIGIAGLLGFSVGVRLV